jgi:hypothetical protein
MHFTARAQSEPPPLRSDTQQASISSLAIPCLPSPFQVLAFDIDAFFRGLGYTATVDGHDVLQQPPQTAPAPPPPPPPPPQAPPARGWGLLGSRRRRRGSLGDPS